MNQQAFGNIEGVDEKQGATAGYLNHPRYSEVAQGRWVVCQPEKERC